MTTAEKMRAVFERGNVATKRVDVFGRHCIVTCWSHVAAVKVASLLQAAGWQVRGPRKSVDEAKDQSKRTTLRAKSIEVYLVGGTMA